MAPSSPSTHAAVFASEFALRGFCQVDHLVSSALCIELAEAFASSGDAHAGQRHLIDHPLVHCVVREPHVRESVHALLSDRAFAFKATLFEKSAEANWLVAWHQDVSIPVASRVDSSQWSAWSIKDGVTYAQPPVEALTRIVALRIHLDDCFAENGPLRVREGSHLLGRLRQDDATRASAAHTEHVLVGARGSAIFMRPLLMHASSKATSPSPRRVLHLEFADFDLPDSAEWRRRVALS